MENVIVSIGSIAEDGENGVYFYLNGWSEDEDTYLNEALMTASTARALALLLVAAADRYEKRTEDYDATSEGRIAVKRNDHRVQSTDNSDTVIIKRKGT